MGKTVITLHLVFLKRFGKFVFLNSLECLAGINFYVEDVCFLYKIYEIGHRMAPFWTTNQDDGVRMGQLGKGMMQMHVKLLKK